MACCARGTTQAIIVIIPSEVITDEILPKLPAKSIVRFKCVSKFFNALISYSKFVAMQLRQSLSSDANRVIILAYRRNTNLHSFDIDSPSSAATAVPIPLPRILEDWLRGTVSIVGSYNGLLCVVLTVNTYDDELHKPLIINPSTGVYRDIPNLNVPNIDSESRVSFGFGFDDMNHDYKLVRIVESYGLDEMELDREVMVYSLKKETWKLMDNIENPTGSLTLNQNGVLMKNHLLHWVFRVSFWYRISCFDLQSEAWVDDVPLSISDVWEEESVMLVVSLSVVHGCLCLVIGSSSSQVVWIMKEYGVKDSWVRLYEIFDPWRICLYGLFGFRQRSKHEILVRNADKSGIFWYDIRSKIFGRAKKIKGVRKFEEAYFFKGSLVPFPGGRLIKAADPLHIPQH